MSATEELTSEEELRSKAVRRLKKRRDFYGHLLVYALVNSFLVVIWWMTDSQFFWPIFPSSGGESSW